MAISRSALEASGFGAAVSVTGVALSGIFHETIVQVGLVLQDGFRLAQFPDTIKPAVVTGDPSPARATLQFGRNR
jgi:hypothetical protein